MKGLVKFLLVWIYVFILFVNVFLIYAEGGNVKVNFGIRSSAFEDGARIPSIYTCESKNISPPLSWSGAPEGTLSFVLICDDPDAPVGTWVHWVFYNIPENVNSLEEGIPASEEFKEGSLKGALQGKNDFGRIGYGGPCPPRGKPHRYFFKLYALDTYLDAKPSLRKSDILKLMHGHILGETKFYALYGR